MAEEKEHKTRIIKPQEGFQERFSRSNVDFVVGGSAMGVGKAQPLHCCVCTPFGYRRIGDLKVGDMICDTNGSTQKIIQIHERGELDCVKILFADGRSALCARDHLWKVRISGRFRYQYQKNKDDYDAQWEIVTTDFIINHLDRKDKHTLYIPNCKPVHFTRGNRTQGLTIHPYLLGCLLGDGCLSDKCANPGMACYDKEIVDKIKSLGYDIRNIPSDEHQYYVYDEKVKKALIQKRLWGKLSDAKSVPNVYLYSTLEDRIELMQGLFDTDGSIDKRGYIEYDTVSEQLAKDVAFLVRSLGGIASISTKQGIYKKKGERIVCKKVYRLYIRLKDAAKFFHLTRKRERAKDYYRICGDCFETAIVGYEPLPKEEMRCISVSHPNNLYITDDFVVTHNSFAALLMAAEHVSDPNFRMVYLRRNISDVKAGGAGADEALKIYGSMATMKMSDSPRLTFPSGAFIDFTHMSDQTPDKVLERIRGWAYSLVYIDEGTGFEWSTIRLIFSRNRSAGQWSGKIRITCNPKKSHWLRQWCAYYIDPVTGYPIPERDGIVRYFYIRGDKIEDVVFGDSKEEVYEQCKPQIDPIVKKMNEGGHHYTYENLIKSTTFYSGKLSDNQALLKNNPNYMGSVAAMGERQAAANLLGCWNVDPDDDSENPIPYDVAESVFLNDPRENNDKWITADLADTGTDNTIILVWNGLHIMDMVTLCTSTPRINVDKLKLMAEKWDIPDSHIIYDGIRAVYVYDYIPDAIPFISYRSSRGKYGRAYKSLKDECFARLVSVVKRQNLSFADKIAGSIYSHQLLNNPITVKVEFIEECSVVRFKDLPGGRRTLLNKKEMNMMLGKGRSMDLLDPIAMRMYPLLDYEYGQELVQTAVDRQDDRQSHANSVNVYSDVLWC